MPACFSRDCIKECLRATQALLHVGMPHQGTPGDGPMLLQVSHQLLIVGGVIAVQHGPPANQAQEMLQGQALLTPTTSEAPGGQLLQSTGGRGGSGRASRGGCACSGPHRRWGQAAAPVWHLSDRPGSRADTACPVGLQGSFCARHLGSSGRGCADCATVQEWIPCAAPLAIGMADQQDDVQSLLELI